MRELRHPLLVLHSDPELQDLLRRSAGTQYEVVILDDWTAAHDAVRDSSLMGAIVVDPYHASTPSSPATMLRSLLRDFPAATIIAALDTSADRVRDARTTGRFDCRCLRCLRACGSLARGRAARRPAGPGSALPQAGPCR